MPVFWIFWRESFEARKQRLASRSSRLGLAGSQNSLPHLNHLMQFNFDSGGICKNGPRDKGIQFCSNSANSGVQATVEIKDFGVQVNLPLLITEDLKGDDLKTRFYTGFNGTFMVIFNSLSLITGKLNYWNGKDSLKEKEYLENDVKQKPGPQRKMRLLDEFCWSS